jgi:Copper type II ascorbate-dependent monooxygenase, C-terminal domain
MGCTTAKYWQAIPAGFTDDGFGRKMRVLPLIPLAGCAPLLLESALRVYIMTLRISCALALSAFAALAADPTFSKDILPLLQKDCQSCHRPGEVAPMSLLTYSDVRPWAKAIKAAVASQKMPPWFADPSVGHFLHDRRLTPEEIATFVAWADNGALEGTPKDAPAPLKFNDGWNIQPDLVVEMPNEFHLPANETIPYQYMLVKGNITEDTWVTAAEMRPGNSKVVHHGEVWVRPPRSHWMREATPGVAYAANEMRRSSKEGNDILGKFNPNIGAQDFTLGGGAKLIPKGSDFVFEIHYTALSTPQADRTKVGLVLARNLPRYRYFTGYGPEAHNLVIPAGDSNAEVVGEITAQDDVTLAYVQPHMHLRGKDYEVRVIYTSGETETVFKGRFDFNWQFGYDLAKPIQLHKGDRILTIAHFDNSANNPANPDPTKEIIWGQQNWDEMQNCFMGLLIDVGKDPATIFKNSGPTLMKRVPGKAGPTLASLEVAPQ